MPSNNILHLERISIACFQLIQCWFLVVIIIIIIISISNRISMHYSEFAKWLSSVHSHQTSICYCCSFNQFKLNWNTMQSYSAHALFLLTVFFLSLAFTVIFSLNKTSIFYFVNVYMWNSTANSDVWLVCLPEKWQISVFCWVLQLIKYECAMPEIVVIAECEWWLRLRLLDWALNLCNFHGQWYFTYGWKTHTHIDNYQFSKWPFAINCWLKKWNVHIHAPPYRWHDSWFWNHWNCGCYSSCSLFKQVSIFQLNYLRIFKIIKSIDCVNQKLCIILAPQKKQTYDVVVIIQPIRLLERVKFFVSAKPISRLFNVRFWRCIHTQHNYILRRCQNVPSDVFRSLFWTHSIVYASTKNEHLRNRNCSFQDKYEKKHSWLYIKRSRFFINA